MQGAQLPGGRRARIQSTETHSLVVAVEIIPAVKIIIVVYYGGIIVTKECKKLQWI